MIDVLKRKGKFEHRPRDLGRILCEGGGRDWADVTTRQVMPRAASQHQKLGESLGHWPAPHLDVGPPELSKQASVVLASQAGHFAPQLRK